MLVKQVIRDRLERPSMGQLETKDTKVCGFTQTVIRTWADWSEKATQ